jgi:hypothetical protein
MRCSYVLLFHKSKTAKGRKAALRERRCRTPFGGGPTLKPSPYFSTDPKMPKGRLSRPFVE